MSDKDTTIEIHPQRHLMLIFDTLGLKSVLKIGRINRREKRKYLSVISLCQALRGVQGNFNCMRLLRTGVSLLKLLETIHYTLCCVLAIRSGGLDNCDCRETRVLHMNDIPSAFSDMNMVTRHSVLHYDLLSMGPLCHIH